MRQYFRSARGFVGEWFREIRHKMRKDVHLKHVLKKWSLSLVSCAGVKMPGQLFGIVRGLSLKNIGQQHLLY